MKPSDHARAIQEAAATLNAAVDAAVDAGLEVRWHQKQSGTPPRVHLCPHVVKVVPVEPGKGDA